MTDEARKARSEYWKKYYQAHKKEHKKRCEDYWQRKADEAKAQQGAEAQTSAPTPDATTIPTDRESANGANEKVTE